VIVYAVVDDALSPDLGPRRIQVRSVRMGSCPHRARRDRFQVLGDALAQLQQVHRGAGGGASARLISRRR